MGLNEVNCVTDLNLKCRELSSMTVQTKIHVVCTCQYFKKHYFENSIKKTSLALVLDSFTEHNNA